MSEGKWSVLVSRNCCVAVHILYDNNVTWNLFDFVNDLPIEVLQFLITLSCLDFMNLFAEFFTNLSFVFRFQTQKAL